ncbi:hypothetical protein CPT_MarsHill_133 [Staphylococcus phage MarsHill]|nr:hypothetical protein CPT_MarsHill_133 [Staphylococcus phage MarsHill]QQO92785.1 hypothetical protein CPT_Madawaska_132 [Staphylococcus phage Madawaska]
MSINKSYTKYFLSKMTDELFSVTNLSRYGINEDHLYLPYLLPNLQIKSEEITISSEEIVDKGGNGKNLYSGTISIGYIFPIIKYSVNNKNSMNMLIIDFDIIFNEEIENENYLKVKIESPYDSDINSIFFNNVIGNILDESNSLKIPFRLHINSMEDLISDFNNSKENNFKNNKDLYQILVKVNSSILEILSQIRDHFNIEFFVSDSCFSHIPIIDKRNNKDMDDKYYNLFDEYRISGVFEEITDERVIKKYLVKNNFK